VWYSNKDINKGVVLNKPKTQKEMIIKYLQEHSSIDRLTALNELGVFELSARITELKRQGYEFMTENKTKKNRYGVVFSYKEYKLKNKE
jgi:hypothetical protein